MDYNERNEKTNNSGIKAHKAAAEKRIKQEERLQERHTSSRKSSGPTRSAATQKPRRPLSKKERMRRRKIRRLKVLAILAALLILCIAVVVAIGKFIVGLFDNNAKEDKQSKTASSLSIEGQEDAVEEATAKLLATGDIIMHKPFIESSMYRNSDGTYNYDSIFKYVKEDFEAADFVTTTIEGSLVDSDYYGYPTFRTPTEIATSLKNNSVDMVLLANNHIYDNGDSGLQTTIGHIEENGLLYTGIRKNTEEKPYTIQDINGIKIGMINYVFETESNGYAKSINGIGVTDEAAPLINSFNSGKLDEFYTEIDGYLKEMQEAGAEFTVAYMHWGVEYDTEGTSEQREMAQKLCDMGLDALIGSHPHVIQPVDLFTSADGSNEMVVAYAIGNQVSNQRTEYMEGLTYGYSEDGYMVELTVKRGADGTVTIDNTQFIPIWLYHSTNGGGEYYVLPLDEPDTLAEKTGLGLGTDVEDSLTRTNGIISTGVEKVKAALPLS